MRIHIIRIAIAVFCLAVIPNRYAASDTLESLVMPGPVIEGHKKYENKCSSCHKWFSKGKQAGLCLDCHKEVKADVRQGRGYHGRIKKKGRLACKACHIDHKGRNADIVKLDSATFNHRLTDFPLRGSHRKLDCASCHKRGKKHREAQRGCIQCHKSDSPHGNRLKPLKKKAACNICHNEKSWLALSFNHDKKTKFKLSGKHKETSCYSCHLHDKYKNTKKACYACHAVNDIHDGANGKKCNKCHNTKGWGKVKFDHDKDTKFPLKGRHAKIKCYACHKGDYKKKRKKTCVSCHKSDDEHKGQFGEKCQNCHRESAWKKIKFNHDRDTDFRIKGRHRKLQCTQCHKGNLYKKKMKKQCYVCHKKDDVHKSKQGTNCNRCHNETGWNNKVRFEHDMSGFPLIGMHAMTPCEECHVDKKYQHMDMACFSCHQNDDVHKQVLGKECSICHNPNSWAIWKFNHNRQSKFKIDGAHKGVHCHSCHRSRVNKMQTSPRACYACHRADDEHNGEFGSRCERCHTTKSFENVKMLQR